MPSKERITFQLLLQYITDTLLQLYLRKMRSGIDSIDIVLKLHSAIRKNFPPCFHSLIPGVIEVWEHQERKAPFFSLGKNHTSWMWSSAVRGKCSHWTTSSCTQCSCMSPPIRLWDIHQVLPLLLILCLSKSASQVSIFLRTEMWTFSWFCLQGDCKSR